MVVAVIQIQKKKSATKSRATPSAAPIMWLPQSQEEMLLVIVGRIAACKPPCTPKYIFPSLPCVALVIVNLVCIYHFY